MSVMLFPTPQASPHPFILKVFSYKSKSWFSQVVEVRLT